MKLDKFFQAKSNKGFTLVELIVVLVILAILAAILVPALLGYIDRARNHKYIVEARDFMGASQAALVEAYAKDKYGFVNSVRPGPLTGQKKQGVADYGYFSSGWVGVALAGKEIDNHWDESDAKGGVFKKILCEKMVQYVESQNYTNISSDTPGLNGKNSAADFKGDRAFFIAYDGSGRIIYMQYTTEGKMVTFDGTSFEVTDGGQFVTHRN